MHQSSWDKMKAFRDHYLGDKEAQSLVILDLGSQNIGGCYRDIFDSPTWKYQGLDLVPGDNVDIILQEPYNWREIPSESADVVVSGQAFEHIEFFWLTMAEIARVLKPEGLCCIIAPSSGFEHRYPVDCWRFYPDGLAALARYAKLEAIAAFTQWDETTYTDGSNEWKDSVLIARKPIALKPVERKPVVQKSTSTPFSISFKHYPKVEIADEKELPENHSLTKQLNLVGYQKRVIDFGCATGYFAQFLKQRECQVVGVELNPEAAQIAKDHCHQVLVADLDVVSIPELLNGQRFDVAVFGDVLEHLRDPWRVLQEVRQILNPEGYIVASIPNIAHGAIRLALLQGKFEYAEMGILDNTHLRFFTRETIETLFEQTGYFLDQVERTTAPIFVDSYAFPQVDREDFDPRLIVQIEQAPEAETVQFIVRAFPLSWEGRYAALRQQNEELIAQIAQLEQLKPLQAELEQVQQHKRQLEADLQQTRTDLQQTQMDLQQAQTDLHQTRTQVEVIQAALESSRTLVAAMETSKFWKLRQAWLRIKKLF